MTAALVAVGLMACGGATPSPNTPQSNNGDNQDSSALLAQILGDLPGGSQTGASSSPPSEQPASQGARSSGSEGSSGGKLDTFDDDVARIKSKTPGWDSGTGIAIKFLGEASGERLSLIFVDPTAPEFKDDFGMWFIQGKAEGSGKTLGNYVLLLKSLEAGRYECSPTKKDVIMSVAMAPTWVGKDPETTWSINEGSWCELVLRKGRGANDLEGSFRAKLVNNEGSGFHTVESGYIYIRR